MVSQWQPFVDQAVAQLVAASVPALADTAVSDVITLGGSEPDINRLAQAAENLNVAVHPRVTAPSSGKDWSSTEEWRADREDDSKSVKQVLAILQEHVCDGNSQAVSVTSRDIFNGAQYPAQFSAKRIKLSPTKTDCLIVAKSAADLAVRNPRSIYHQVCGLSSPRCFAQTHASAFTHVMDMLLDSTAYLSIQSYGNLLLKTRCLHICGYCAAYYCTLVQLFGMVEIKRPAAFQSRLDTWRAQAQAQLLGVNYIVYQCVTQQPMGSGIPVLLTSFEDGQAILFTEKPDGDRDGMSEVWFESTADALEIFELGVANRQTAEVQTVSMSSLRDEMRASAAPRVGQAGELNTYSTAGPGDLSALGPPELNMRARFDLAHADYLASLQSAMNPLIGHADLPDLAYWLPYVNTVIETMSGSTQHLPVALHDIMHEQWIRQRGPPDNMFT